MKDCLFCKILNKEIPSYKIYEDEYTYAFLDISKDYEGHTLVIPKKHYDNIIDCDQETLNHLMNTIKIISSHYLELGYKGINIFNNNNKEGEQAILHLHFHLIPRKENENFSIYASNEKHDFDLEKLAKKLSI